MILSIVLMVILVVLIVFIINRKSIKIKILEEEAEKGNPETQLALGLMFYSGVQIHRRQLLFVSMMLLLKAVL